jgi:pimeloyl-ACP methyl ester carboxylesterase
VVLLHGLASQRRFWNLVVPGLAGLPLVALDQRGHGDSDRPEHGPYDVGACADDLAVALDALGVDRAVVVGHSWGASVAAAFGRRHAHRTLAVVAVDGALRRPVTGPQRAELRARLEPPRLARPPEELRAMFAARFGRQDAAEALLAGFAVHDDGLARARLDFDRHLQVLDGMLDHDPVADLLGLDRPVWVVACEGGGPRDPQWAAAREAALGELSGAPDVRVLRWGGAEHDVPLQWPALVSGLVRAAVEEVASSTEVADRAARTEAEASRRGA